MTATIEVSRPAQKGWRRDVFRRYRVFIDDVEVARLKEGEACFEDVTPGAHRVEARIDWMGSGEVAVRLADGEAVRIAIYPGTWSLMPPHDRDGYIAIEVRQVHR